MKQVFKIGNAEELNSPECMLLVEAGRAHCCFAIVGWADKLVKKLAYYTAEENETADMIQTIFAEHSELKNHFHQTVIGYYIPETVILPSRFFKFEQAGAISESVHGKMHSATISEAVLSWQLHLAYDVPTPIHQTITRQWPSGNSWHVHSVVLKTATPAEGETIFMDFKTNDFSVVVIKNNSLLLAQIYNYTAGEDVLYWLLKICEQYRLSQTGINLILSGLIDKESAVHDNLHQYFLNISFASVNGMKLGEEFSEYPEHFFSSLYKLASCAS
jgi:hypothetical protein